MSFFDELKKLTRPYDNDDEFFDTDAASAAPVEDEPRVQEKRSSFFAEPDPVSQTSSIPTPTPRTSRRDSRLESRVVNVGASQQKVVIVSPTQFEEAADIAEHLKDKRTVVMNLENADKITARRLIDFLSGFTYALEGKVKKVSGSIFLIMPDGVGLMGDLADEIENSSLYF